MNAPSSLGLFKAFLRLGITALGGPAMIAHIKEVAVARYKWLNESDFKDGIILCQAIPGATAMQMVALRRFENEGILRSFFSIRWLCFACLCAHACIVDTL